MRICHNNSFGLPGHFVVRANVGPDPVLLDPFDGGAVLTPERAAEVVARALGRRAPLTEQHLAPVTKRQILSRLLVHLAGIYGRNGDLPRSLDVLERLAVLEPNNARITADLETLRRRVDGLN